MQAGPAARPQAGTADAPGGRVEARDIGPGWWNRYHNQLLAMAITMSVAAAALVLRIEDIPGYHGVPVGIAIGVGSGIGFLLSYRKRYARVAAGEFASARGTRAPRAVRYMKSLALFSVPASFAVIVAGVGCFALLGMVGPVFAFVLGMSITWWALYCITVVWERRHRATLISERGWMYTIDTAAYGDNRMEGVV